MEETSTEIMNLTVEIFKRAVYDERETYELFAIQYEYDRRRKNNMLNEIRKHLIILPNYR